MGTPRKIVKSVRIVSLGNVAPSYLLRPKVIAAVKREIEQDLKTKDVKRSPTGTEITWKTESRLHQIIRKIKGVK